MQHPNVANYDMYIIYCSLEMTEISLSYSMHNISFYNYNNFEENYLKAGGRLKFFSPYFHYTSVNTMGIFTKWAMSDLEQ